jgi:hypothetical protein
VFRLLTLDTLFPLTLFSTPTILFSYPNPCTNRINHRVLVLVGTFLLGYFYMWRKHTMWATVKERLLHAKKAATPMARRISVTAIHTGRRLSNDMSALSASGGRIGRRFSRDLSTISDNSKQAIRKFRAKRLSFKGAGMLIQDQIAWQKKDHGTKAQGGVKEETEGKKAWGARNLVKRLSTSGNMTRFADVVVAARESKLEEKNEKSEEKLEVHAKEAAMAQIQSMQSMSKTRAREGKAMSKYATAIERGGTTSNAEVLKDGNHLSSFYRYERCMDTMIGNGLENLDDDDLAFLQSQYTMA